MNGLRDLPHIVDIRANGLMAGIELEPRTSGLNNRAYDIFVDCFEHGLLVRVTGDIIALLPPIIAERDHIECMVVMLGNALGCAR